MILSLAPPGQAKLTRCMVSQVNVSWSPAAAASSAGLSSGVAAAGARVRVADRVAPRDPEVPTVPATSATRRSATGGDRRLTGIVHLAAFTSVLGSLADPAGVHEINVDATAGLLELARRRGVGGS